MREREIKACERVSVRTPSHDLCTGTHTQTTKRCVCVCVCGGDATCVGGGGGSSDGARRAVRWRRGTDPRAAGGLSVS